jgi:hypothetical protein
LGILARDNGFVSRLFAPKPIPSIKINKTRISADYTLHGHSCIFLLYGWIIVWANRTVSPLGVPRAQRKPFKNLCALAQSVFSVVSRYVAHSFSHSHRWTAQLCPGYYIINLCPHWI